MRYSVQVQIVTYNSESCISQCLNSVLNQTYPIRKIIIIDNASRDNTVATVEKHFNDIEVIQLQTNVGYAAGHNIGFRIAIDWNIDFVLTLNPDVTLGSYYVEKLIEEFFTNIDSLSRLGGITGKLLRDRGDLVTNPIIDTAGLQMGMFYHVHDRGSGQNDTGQYDALKQVWGICGAAAIYKVEMLRDISFQHQVFDESFFIYKEDVDLCWRANRSGWHFAYVPGARAFHTRGWKAHGQKKLPKHALVHSFANQVALLIAYAPRWSLYLFVTLWVESIRFLLLSIRAPNVSFQTVKVIRANWSWMWQKRRELNRSQEEGYGMYL